ncbi:MAG: hypothetical protein JRE40_00175 [Deltaproteobacteria bacterium]|nr:hypothetical protein [Deltaproteobacteria bacterium]
MVNKLISEEESDLLFDVIAREYFTDLPTGGGISICHKCPQHKRCKVFVRWDIPIDCEKVSKSDLMPLGRVSDDKLLALGWLDRVELWSEESWGLFYRFRDEVVVEESKELGYD